MRDLDYFCDMRCKYAQQPKEEGMDGSGSCRTFIALYCKRKNRLVAKNLPCKQKVLQTKRKVSTKGK
jgi:hypothetical protein